MAALEVGRGGVCAGQECRWTRVIVSARIHACCFSEH